MDTGSRIKLFRKRAGLSQEMLAKKVGYTDRSSISKIESGETELTDSKILLFAKALGVSVTDILGMTDPDEKEKPATQSSGSGLNIDVSKASPEQVELIQRILNYSDDQVSAFLSIARQLKGGL